MPVWLNLRTVFEATVLSFSITERSGDQIRRQAIAAKIEIP
ncbi:hypothetical protein J765_2372, partial [Acinetobacter baumannii 25307_2]